MEPAINKENNVAYGTNLNDQEIQKDKQRAYDENTDPPYKATAKLWISITVCLIGYVTSLYGMVAISTQYFSKRIAKDDYGFDFTDKDERHCDNASGEEENRVDRVQKDVAELQLKFTITTGIPALFVSLIVGSYSDYIGRKPLLLVSMAGGFLKVLVLTFIIAFDLDLTIFYGGAFLDGLVGSFYTTVTAVTSIIADVTFPKERAIKFAIIEGILVVCVALSQIGIGVLIHSIGYLAPSIIIGSLFLLVTGVVILLCPETSQAKPIISHSPLVHFRRVFGFYIYKDPLNKRRLYLIGITSFFLGSATNAGRGNVEVLFETSYPLCWGSLEVGYFTAIRLVLMAVAAVVFLKVAHNHLSLEVTGLICALSGVAGYVLEGFAKSSGVMFFAALVGVLYQAVIPLPRALLSQLASSSEQGALFSSLSTIDVIATMTSTAVFTAIYNSTLDSFKGAVFIAVGAICLINSGFFLIFRYHRRALPKTSELTVEAPEPSKANGIVKKPVAAVSESSPLVKEN